MRFRKLISAMIASVMLFTCLSLPANANIDINIAGGGGLENHSYAGGEASDKWSPGNIHNRFGYRISVYYAPQKTDGNGEYVYENGEPVYDWDGPDAQPVGKTIDVRMDAMTLDGNEVLPKQCGTMSIWEYINRDGGAPIYSKFDRFCSIVDSNNDYFYYRFNGENPNQKNYICALFNTDTLKNYYGWNSGTDKLSDSQLIDKMTGAGSPYDRVMKRLEEIDTSDEKVAKIINDVKDKLGESNDQIKKYGVFNLPIINNRAEGNHNSADTTDRLRNYLIHPAILEMISEATCGGFTAEDFYFGTWAGRNESSDGYKRGTYKLVIENMTTTGVNGPLTSYTLADSIAVGTVNGNDVYSQLGPFEYADGMVNTLTLKHSDPVLKFKNLFTDDGIQMFMGDILYPFDDPVYSKITSDNWTAKNTPVLDYAKPNEFIGNYSGLAVIDSDSIYSRADVSKSQIVNEVMVSRVGKPDLGVTGLQINTDAAELSQFVSSDAINALCAAFDNEDVNLIAERAGLEDDGFKLQLTALCDAIRRGRAYGLDSSEIKVAIRDAYNWDGYDTATKENKLKQYSGDVSQSEWFKQLYSPDSSLNYVLSRIKTKDMSEVIKDTNSSLSNRDYAVKQLNDPNIFAYDLVDGDATLSQQVSSYDTAKLERYTKNGKKQYGGLAYSGRMRSLLNDADKNKEQLGLIELPKVEISYNGKEMQNDSIRKYAALVHDRISAAMGGEGDLIKSVPMSDTTILNAGDKQLYIDTDNFLNFYKKDALKSIETIGDAKVYSVDSKDLGLPLGEKRIYGEGEGTEIKVSETGTLIYGDSDTQLSCYETEDAFSSADVEGMHVGITGFKNGDELLESLLTKSLTNTVSSNFKYEGSSKGDKFMSYTGTVSINNFVIDNVCPVEVTIVNMNTETGKVQIMPNKVSAGYVSRFQPLEVVSSLTMGTYKYKLWDTVANVKAIGVVNGGGKYNKDSDINEYINKVVDVLKNGSTGDLKADYNMAVGYENVRKAKVYPSGDDLDSGKTMNVVIVVEEASNNKIVKVYDNEKNQHIETKISKLPAGTTSVDVDNEDDFEVTDVIISDTEPTKAITSDTEWDEIVDNCPDTGGQTLDTERLPQKFTMTPGNEETIYILYTKKPGIKTTSTGDFHLGQQSISGIYSTEKAGLKPQLNYSWQLKPKSAKHTCVWTESTGMGSVTRTHRYSYLQRYSSDKFNIKYSMDKHTLDEYGPGFKVLGIWDVKDNEVPYTQLYRGNKSTASAVNAGEYLNTHSKILLWRGLDAPVVADYAYYNEDTKDYVYDTTADKLMSSNPAYNSSSANSHMYGTNRNEALKQPYFSKSDTNGYVTPFAVDYNHDGIKQVWFNWVGCRCDDPPGPRSATIVPDTRVIDTSLGVDIYKYNSGKDKSSVTSKVYNGAGEDVMYGKNMHINSTSIAGNTYNYFPYVKMYLDTDYINNTKSGLPVNVLSKYMSTLATNDVVEVGYREGKVGYSPSGGDTSGIVMHSDMWSTHKRATQDGREGRVLAGGATYGLDNSKIVGGEMIDTQPIIGIKTYGWFAVEPKSVYQGGNSVADATERHNKAFETLKRNVVDINSGSKLQQRIEVGGSTVIPKPGDGASWLNGLPYLTDDKYWFSGTYGKTNGIPLKTYNDALNNDKCTYVVKSDTDGYVYLIQNGTQVVRFDKTVSTDTIINNWVMNNDAWRDVEIKTGLVRSYLNTIIRGDGSDTTYVSDGRWYNEAFPGVGIIVQTSVCNVGMDDNYTIDPSVGDWGSMQNAVNLRYVADNTTGVAGIYTKFLKTWFETSDVVLKATYNGSDAKSAGAVKLVLRTKDWYLPNATVYDND